MPLSRLDPLPRGAEDDRAAGVADGELPVAVRDREVAGRDVGAGRRARGLHVDPPVASCGVVADVVRKILRDRDDGAGADVRPQGIAAQGEDLRRGTRVFDDEFPAPQVLVIDRHHQLEPVPAVALDRSPEAVRAGVLQEVRVRDRVVLVQDDRSGGWRHADVADIVAEETDAGIGARLAVECRIAGLDPVAEQEVVAERVVGDALTGIRHAVAGVDGAAHAVVAVPAVPAWQSSTGSQNSKPSQKTPLSQEA